MEAICVPIYGVALIPRQQKNMSTPPASSLHFSVQFVTLFLVQRIMTENDAGTERQPTNSIEQFITKAWIGHDPDFGQGVAAAHTLAYSAHHASDN